MSSNASDVKVVEGRTISGMVISDVVVFKVDDIGDGNHVASKHGDVGDNGGITCGAIDEGGVEASGAKAEDDVHAWWQHHHLMCRAITSPTTFPSTSNRLHPNYRG